jgi:hypothetical protein
MTITLWHNFEFDRSRSAPWLCEPAKTKPQRVLQTPQLSTTNEPLGSVGVVCCWELFSAASGVPNSAALVAENCSFHARAAGASANKTDVFKHLSRSVTGVTFYYCGANYQSFTVTLGTFRRKWLFACGHVSMPPFSTLHLMLAPSSAMRGPPVYEYLSVAATIRRTRKAGRRLPLRRRMRNRVMLT